MSQKAQQQLIARFRQATGRADCTQIVVLQRRPRWAIAAVTAFTLVAVAITNELYDPGTIVAGAIVGAAVGAAFWVVVTGYWLGVCDDRIVLVQVARSPKGPHEVIGEWPIPIPGSISSGLLTKRVTVDGESYIMGRQFEQTFRTIAVLQ